MDTHSDSANSAEVKRLGGLELRNEVLRLRKLGWKYIAIAAQLGFSTTYCWHIVKAQRLEPDKMVGSSRDPLSGVDHRNIGYRVGESPEQRAFRRHPINSHKAGGWE